MSTLFAGAPPAMPDHRPVNHFLTLDSLGVERFHEVLALAHRAKAEPCDFRKAIPGGKVGMIFDKPSTRTRISLEGAAWGLGMLPIVLRPEELQLGRGETIADTGRVLSRYLDAITIRTFAQARVEELAAAASVPVINALTDEHHPLQALADVMTIEAAFGTATGCRVAYVGDGNNVAHSLAQAAALGGFHLTIATPPGYEPDPAIIAEARDEGLLTGGEVALVNDPVLAVDGADVVYTDVWASMGKDGEAAERARAFAGYTVDAELMARARSHAIFLHCLPAHRGLEVLDEVIDGPASRVWDQAENRLHTGLALLYTLITRDERGDCL
ncbi:MAG TPA: ornithine carbamoyltransferase [Candidatus Limnocylindrales bacterium]